MMKKFFDLKLSQFSKYLNKIGILSELDIEQFQKKFYEISSDIYNCNNIFSNDINVNYIYFKEKISNALVYFIKSLSEEEQKMIALNIFMNYDKKEDLIKQKLINIIKLLSKQYLRIYFLKWKEHNMILKNQLKRVISSHILSNLSNIKNNESKKNIFTLNDNKENNLTNDNTIDTNNNNCKNNLKVNNSMVNFNSHILNISTTPDINSKNYNNSSYYEINGEDNIINNYIYDKKHKQIKIDELNNTYSMKYYHNPNNYFNNNSSHYNSIQNIMNKTNYNIKYHYPSKYTISKSNSNNSYNSYTFKSKEFSNNKNKHKVNLEYLNNLSKSKTEHNLNPEKVTQYLKEQEELNNYCTFKPKINKSSSFSGYNNMSNKKSIDRLYLDSKNRIARKELQALKKSNLESKENTFKPNFISSSVKKIKSKFNKRLKDFEIIKKNNIKKLSSKLENEEKQQFTFSPNINQPLNNKRNNINNSSSNISKTSNQNENILNKRKKIPAFKRLYNESKDKKLRQEKRVKQEIEKIKNSSKISENKNFDTKKIEELYNDYKIKKKKLQKKQEQIEKEQGITFKPELISEKKYLEKINPDFYEREKQFLEKQKQNIEIYNLLLENEEKKRKKNYSEEEKKEIYSNIVNRLYKDGVEKYIQKRNKENDFDNINNENEIKDEFIIKNGKCKNIDLENEKEPEEEIFIPNYSKIGINKDYLINHFSTINHSEK